MPEELCPIFTIPHHKRRRRKKRGTAEFDDENVEYILRDEMKIHQRQPLIPFGKFYPTYIIWTSDIPRLLKVRFFQNCIVILPMFEFSRQKVDPDFLEDSSFQSLK